jgi:hypothetical protein
MLWSATTPETTKTEEKKLPEIVTKARADVDAKNFKNYQTFKTNWIKNETERLKTLNDALKSATQKGDFDTCLAIKEEITGVESLITLLNDPTCKMVSYEFKDNKTGENGKNKTNDAIMLSLIGVWTAQKWPGVKFYIEKTESGMISMKNSDGNILTNVVVSKNQLIGLWRNCATLVVEIDQNTKMVHLSEYDLKFDGTNLDKISTSIIIHNKEKLNKIK